MMAGEPREWRLLTRPGCHLCDEMAAVLERVLGAEGIGWRAVDVDGDAVLRARWGETIPVLLRDGAAVARIRLDEPRLRRLIAGRR